MTALTGPKLDCGDHPADDWTDTPVSSRSRFGNDVWELDIFVAGRAPRDNRISWNQELPDGARITGAQHAGLIRAVKQYLWSMALHPPPGRKRLCPSTLHSHGKLLQVIVGWMALEGTASFRALTPMTVGRLIAWLRTRPGAGGKGNLTPISVALYLNVVNTMFVQRAKLEDSPVVNPLPGETPFGAAGVSQATGGSIPFIPDDIAVHLLSRALTWVEVHSSNILAAVEVREQTIAKLRLSERCDRPTSDTVARALRRAAITGPDGRPIAGGGPLRTCTMHLSTACFVLIAGFVGMRPSEILSLQVGAIEHHPIGETGVEQAYVVGRLFKTSDEPKGRLERWVAPAPVVRAVSCLEKLTASLRKEAGSSNLFLTKYVTLNRIGATTNAALNWRLRQFAQRVGAPTHEGEVWHLSPSQFRKTFARFVARGDRSHLLALADHFKHISVSMTSRGYVGTDFELHELVDEESRAETAIALDRLLSSDRLGGRMGERIVARNHAFRGRAGEQVRRDYIDFVLAETDLRIRGCDYGWCVFQPEVALCGGEVAPNEAGRSPSVCAKCANLAVDDRHIPYWQDRRRRNLALWDRASPLARAVLAEAVEECDRMLRRIEEGRNDKRAEPDRAEPKATPPGNSAG